VYSLLGASLLGFDLVRRPGGGAVASLLVEALALGPSSLPVLAEGEAVGFLDPELPSPDHRGLGDVLGEVTRLVAAGRAGEALTLVEQAPVAGLGELLRFVREDVFEWAWESGPDGPVQDVETRRAVAVVCDAVVAAYHAEGTSRALHAQLLEPWALARGRLGPLTADLGPCSSGVLDLLHGVAALEHDGLAQLIDLSRSVRRHGPWGPAMHAASWAAYLADRVRPAACAQLLAARAVSQLDVDTAATAGGAWNLVSGAVQAAVVTDLLDDASRDRLLTPLTQLLGP
jgi:hypothetical protein